MFSGFLIFSRHKSSLVEDLSRRLDRENAKDSTPLRFNLQKNMVTAYPDQIQAGDSLVMM
jgi:hypothetical protein